MKPHLIIIRKLFYLFLGLICVWGIVFLPIYDLATARTTTFRRLGCHCSPISVQEELPTSDAVFAGTVISANYLPTAITSNTRTRAITFEVVSAWKGVSENRYTVFTGDICEVWPAEGENWLVFTENLDNLPRILGFCGQTDQLWASRSKENIKYLGTPTWGAEVIPAHLFQEIHQ